MFITTAEQPVDNPSNRPPFVRKTTTTAPAGTTPRILAIDPGTSLMGVAVLERSELLYYGVKELKRMRPVSQLLKATREVVLDLIDRYQPTVLAYEETFYVQQASSVLLRAHEREIQSVGRWATLKIRAYSPLYIRQALCGDSYATKQMVADVLVRNFPELAKYRPAQSLRSERYWLNMFDAVAIGVVAAGEVERGSGSSGGAKSARAA